MFQPKEMHPRAAIGFVKIVRRLIESAIVIGVAVIMDDEDPAKTLPADLTGEVYLGPKPRMAYEVDSRKNVV